MAKTSETVLEILEREIRAKEHDGLFNAAADCACEAGDLVPCVGIQAECMTGVMAPCDCGEHAWHICRVKEEAPRG